MLGTVTGGSTELVWRRRSTKRPTTYDVKSGYNNSFFFFFFNDPAPPEIYPLPPHDALPIPGGPAEIEIRDRMTVYVCGITPYDVSHLGHAFTFTHFDVLVRYLRYLGAEVVHAQNVTDVDDDILRVAKERGIDWQELARTETAKLEACMRTVGYAPPAHE